MTSVMPRPSNGRPPACSCGECPKCVENARRREQWASKTPEERRAVVARRDKAAVRKRDAERMKVGRRAIQRKAWVAVGHALRDGALTRGACSVSTADCEGPIEGHHPDYSQPLEVVWLCRKHHKELHKQMASTSTEGETGWS